MVCCIHTRASHLMHPLVRPWGFQGPRPLRELQLQQERTKKQMEKRMEKPAQGRWALAQSCHYGTSGTAQHKQASAAD